MNSALIVSSFCSLTHVSFCELPSLSFSQLRLLRVRDGIELVDNKISTVTMVHLISYVLFSVVVPLRYCRFVDRNRVITILGFAGKIIS